MNKHNIKALQHYNIFKDRVLGKGTFGCVFQGEDTKNNIPVAIKMIPLEKFKRQPEKIIPSLKNEIKNMQLLHHKNIVQLYNVIKTENNLYIIVEYCNAGSLESVIKQKNRTEEMCINIMCQIVEGFKCLYSNNIVHRDLKPENILLNDRTVKIADFGFSKVVEAGMDEPTLYSFVGTPLYMSPQVLQKQNYSSKTDIWSLGMIFYELIYCKRAWEGKGYFILLENILNKPLHFPQVPKVHEQTKQIIKKMLQLKEEDRISWDELFSFFSTDFLKTIYSDFPSNQISQQQQQHQQSQQQQQPQQQQRIQSSLNINKQLQLNELYELNSNGRNLGHPSSPSSVVSMKSERIEEDDKLSDFRPHSDNNIGRMEEEEKPKEKNTSILSRNASFKAVSTEDEEEDEQVNDSQMGKLLEYVHQNLNYSQNLQLVINMQSLINKNRGQKLTMSQVKQMMMYQLKTLPQNLFGSQKNIQNEKINDKQTIVTSQQTFINPPLFQNLPSPQQIQMQQPNQMTSRMQIPFGIPQYSPQLKNGIQQYSMQIKNGSQFSPQQVKGDNKIFNNLDEID